MNKIRAVFSKTGRAKYISHLDLNRCMQRAFKRSGLPVWYTEGFNPHIYITFALPLSLGYESGCEIMDFSLTEEVPEEKILSALNAAVPDGLSILKVYTPETKHTDIAFAEYEIVFSGEPESVAKSFHHFMESDRISVMKKTKRGGVKEIDLKPDTEVLSLGIKNGSFTAVLRLPAGNEKNINPSLLTDAFIGQTNVGAEVESVRRTGILSSSGEDFF